MKFISLPKKNKTSTEKKIKISNPPKKLVLKKSSVKIVLKEN